jgi:hypothetical protein
VDVNVEVESREEDESERRMVGIWAVGLKCRSTSCIVSTAVTPLR